MYVISCIRQQSFQKLTFTLPVVHVYLIHFLKFCGTFLLKSKTDHWKQSDFQNQHLFALIIQEYPFDWIVCFVYTFSSCHAIFLSLFNPPSFSGVLEEHCIVVHLACLHRSIAHTYTPVTDKRYVLLCVA